MYLYSIVVFQSCAGVTDGTIHFVNIPVSLLYNQYSGYSCLLVLNFPPHMHTIGSFLSATKENLLLTSSQY